MERQLTSEDVPSGQGTAGFRLWVRGAQHREPVLSLKETLDNCAKKHGAGVVRDILKAYLNAPVAPLPPPLSPLLGEKEQLIARRAAHLVIYGQSFRSMWQRLSNGVKRLGALTPKVGKQMEAKDPSPADMAPEPLGEKEEALCRQIAQNIVNNPNFTSALANAVSLDEMAEAIARDQ